MNDVLRVRDLYFAYGDKQVLNGISFELHQGEILGLLGPNGCGKTTTFKILANLYQPISGEITLFGQKINFDNINLISYMTEDRSLFAKYKVEEMLNYLGHLKGLTGTYLSEQISKWLETFHLSEMRHKRVGQLSKGNQQKVQLVACLINQPKLLILDEPFTGLDVMTVYDLITVLKQLRDAGVMIIFSSHRINDVESFCDRVVMLNHGEVIINGNLKMIKKDYKKKIIRFQADDFDPKTLNTQIPYYYNNDLDCYIFESDDEGLRNNLVKTLKKYSTLSLLSVDEVSLEEIFLHQISKINNGK